MTASSRRITLDLRRWPLRVTFGIRPTVVIDGRTEPAQWGVGTWQVPADREVGVTVFLFVAGLRLGVASIAVGTAVSTVVYRAPWLAVLPGRISAR